MPFNVVDIAKDRGFEVSDRGSTGNEMIIKVIELNALSATVSCIYDGEITRLIPDEVVEFPDGFRGRVKFRLTNVTDHKASFLVTAASRMTRS